MGKQNICDLCIIHDLALQSRHNNIYVCQLEMGLKTLEGKYRRMTVNEEDYNYECTYHKEKEIK